MASTSNRYISRHLMYSRERCKKLDDLQSATASTTLLAGRVRGDWSAVLNTADLHASSGQGSESTLSSGSGGLGSVSTGGTELDMQSSDSKSLNFLSNVLGSQHSSIGRRFISVSLHLHTTSNSADGFTSRDISYMDESIVERSIDVSHTKYKLSLTNLRSKRNLNLLLNFLLSLTRCHLLSLVEVNQAILA